MRHPFLAALTWCTVAVALSAGPPPQKKPAAPAGKPATAVAQKNVAQKNVAQKSVAQKSSTQKGAAPKTVINKPAVTTAHHSTTTTGSKTAPTAVRTTTAKNRYSSYRPPVRRYSGPPPGPTADRYREIQDALAAQGYLKTPSTGVWDKDSIDAMQRFQKDKNLDPTGKLTARSLGELGLGSKPPEAPSPSPNPPAKLGANSQSDVAPPQ